MLEKEIINNFNGFRVVPAIIKHCLAMCESERERDRSRRRRKINTISIKIKCKSPICASEMKIYKSGTEK